MNRTVLRYSFLTNAPLLAAAAVVIGSMVLSLAWLFPLLSADATYTEMLDTIPEQLRQALGVSGDQTQYFGFLTANYYNSLHLYFMMALVLLLGHRLVSKPIDDTSLNYFLNGALPRASYLIARLVFFLLASVGIAVVSLASMVLGQLVFDWGSPIEWRGMVVLNVNLLVLFLFLGSVVFLIRMLTNTGVEALAGSTGLVIFQYFLSMVEPLSPHLSFLRYFTVFSLFDVDRHVGNTGVFAAVVLGLTAASVAVSAVSVQLFRRKDLFL